MQDDGRGWDNGTKTLVMPLQNGTQKKKVLVPDFRRDDEERKFSFISHPSSATMGFSPLLLLVENSKLEK